MCLLEVFEMTKRVRLTVDLPVSIEERLSALALEYGATKTEVIRDGIKLIVALDGLKKDGFTVGGWKVTADGTREYAQIIVL